MQALEIIYVLFLEPPEIVPFTFGSDTINQGEFAQLICVVRKGDMPITLSWSLKGDAISSDPDLSTTMLGQRTSMLTISSVNYRHSGTYTCRATNPGGSVTHTATLNVNGKSYTMQALEIFVKLLVLIPPEIVPFTFGTGAVNP